MNQKGFANIILILIIVILVGAVGYLVLTKQSGVPSIKQNQQTNQQPTTPSSATTQTPSQQTPNSVATDKTSNWEIYRNDQYGFEFKYPIGAKEMQNKKVFGENILFALNLTPTQTKWNNLNLDVATVNIPNCYYSPLGQSVKKETLTVNSSSFCLNIEEDSGTSGMASRDYYYTTKKGSEYLLLSFHIEYNKYCGLNYPEFAKCEKFNPIEDTQVFNQIISTFRFIQ